MGYTRVTAPRSPAPRCAGCARSIAWTPPHFWALPLGAAYLGYAVRIYTAYSDRLAQRCFRYSIVYLAALFAALLVDHYLA